MSQWCETFYNVWPRKFLNSFRFSAGDEKHRWHEPTDAPAKRYTYPSMQRTERLKTMRARANGCSCETIYLSYPSMQRTETLKRLELNFACLSKKIIHVAFPSIKSSNL